VSQRLNDTPPGTTGWKSAQNGIEVSIIVHMLPAGSGNNPVLSGS
jgi:hypothetical protein